MICNDYINGTSPFCDNPHEIENYEKAKSDMKNMWVCHHRRETDDGCTSQWLIENDLYFHRPPSELIFLKRSEHRRLHLATKIIFDVDSTSISTEKAKVHPNYISRKLNIMKIRLNVLTRWIKDRKYSSVIDYMKDECNRLNSEITKLENNNNQNQ